MKDVKILAKIAAVLCVAATLLTSCVGGKNPAETTPSDTTPPVTTPGDTSDITSPDDTTSGMAPETTPDTAPGTTPADTTTAPVNPGLGAAAAYRLDGLPCDKVVQQFAMLHDGAGLWIFTVQRVGDMIYLSRLKVGSDGKVASMVDFAVLPGYGHGESFDLAVIDGKVYLYVASDANPINSYGWATSVTRLRYEAGQIVDERVIVGMERATANGQLLHSDAQPFRINFALDAEADIISFYIRTDKNGTGKNGYHYLTAYRLSAINAMLDASPMISLADATGAFLGTTGQKALEDICYNTSFQGMEVCADGSICIIGGTQKIKPRLSRFELADGKISRRRVLSFEGITTDILRSRNWTAATSFIEIEGACWFEGALYCSFNPANANLSSFDSTEIFIITEK